jgi:RraA family protein
MSQMTSRQNIQMTPIFRLSRCDRAIPASVIEAFKGIPTPNISDSMGKLAMAGAGLRAVHRGARMIGRAITVRVPPGDNLLAYKGIFAAEPGDVLVIDAGGDLQRAIIGEIMSTWAAQRGLAGIVVWGAVRDVDVLGESDFPVYALGVTHRGPYKNGPGELNATVSIGGMVVSPGDLIVGDASGVVAVPFEAIASTLESASAIQRREDELVAQIKAGRYDASWIDPALTAAGLTVV